MNHSCRPTVELQLVAGTESCQKGGNIGYLRAARTIKAGDALTFFYPSTEWVMDQPFKCKCNEVGCLRQISGAIGLTEAQASRYFFNDHIERLMTEKALLKN